MLSSRGKIPVLMLFKRVQSYCLSQQSETTFKITIDPRVELMNSALTFTNLLYYGKISDEKCKYYKVLNNDAQINSKDRDYQMALNLATRRGFNSFIDFLLDSSAEYDATPGGAYLKLSSAAGRIDTKGIK